MIFVAASKAHNLDVAELHSHSLEALPEIQTIAEFQKGLFVQIANVGGKRSLRNGATALTQPHRGRQGNISPPENLHIGTSRMLVRPESCSLHDLLVNCPHQANLISNLNRQGFVLKKHVDRIRSPQIAISHRILHVEIDPTGIPIVDPHGCDHTAGLHALLPTIGDMSRALDLRDRGQNGLPIHRWRANHLAHSTRSNRANDKVRQ